MKPKTKKVNPEKWFSSVLAYFGPGYYLIQVDNQNKISIRAAAKSCDNLDFVNSKVKEHTGTESEAEDGYFG